MIDPGSRKFWKSFKTLLNRILPSPIPLQSIYRLSTKTEKALKKMNTMAMSLDVPIVPIITVNGTSMIGTLKPRITSKWMSGRNMSPIMMQKSTGIARQDQRNTRILCGNRATMKNQ